MTEANIGTSCKAEAQVRRGPSGIVARSGNFDVVCRGADGSVKWEDHAKNGVVNEGNARALDVMFHNVAATSAWYIGLIDGASATLSAADTLVSNAWTENTAYDEAARVSWLEGAATVAAPSVITNPATSDFTMNATDTIYGMFLTTNSVKGNTGGVLWATAAFAGGAKAVVSGDTLEVTYTITSTAT